MKDYDSPQRPAPPHAASMSPRIPAADKNGDVTLRPELAEPTVQPAPASGPLDGDSRDGPCQPSHGPSVGRTKNFTNPTIIHSHPPNPAQPERPKEDQRSLKQQQPGTFSIPKIEPSRPQSHHRHNIQNHRRQNYNTGIGGRSSIGPIAQSQPYAFQCMPPSGLSYSHPGPVIPGSVVAGGYAGGYVSHYPVPELPSSVYQTAQVLQQTHMQPQAYQPYQYGSAINTGSYPPFYFHPQQNTAGMVPPSFHHPHSHHPPSAPSGPFYIVDPSGSGPNYGFNGRSQSSVHYENAAPLQARTFASMPSVNPSNAPAPASDSLATSQDKQVPSTTTTDIQSTLRGPPRKPRQSGHAIWVGNLPLHAKVIDLKDHFSREATTDIESVFLISKSHCAFVNYKTREACTAAVARFNNSTFQGTHLLCRLRQAEKSVASLQPSIPPVQVDPTHLPDHKLPGPTNKGSSDVTTESPVAAGLPLGPISIEGPNRASDTRYFIIKSLTRQDIESSIQTGIWATQKHNEPIFNKAYEVSDNVLLIFSANKTGEYHGYARMAGLITEDNYHGLVQSNESETKATTFARLSSIIHTPKTEWAPEGRIIDEPDRGTIYWEATERFTLEESTSTDSDPSQNSSDSNSAMASQSSKSSAPTASSHFEDSKTGIPFQVEWKSTQKLPFVLTRGIKNPWNDDKEVKVARDGTEIEPSIGSNLIKLFRSLENRTPVLASTFGTPTSLTPYRSNTTTVGTFNLPTYPNNPPRHPPPNSRGPKAFQQARRF